VVLAQPTPEIAVDQVSISDEKTVHSNEAEHNSPSSSEESIADMESDRASPQVAEQTRAISVTFEVKEEVKHEVKTPDQLRIETHQRRTYNAINSKRERKTKQ